jgi:prepilin-type N-terminal cleavage/methylation domain-containing protein
MIFRKSESGFTLVEVLVSLLIFLVTSLGLLPLLWTNMASGQNLGLHDRARELTGEAMAEMQAVEYESMEILGGIQLQQGPFVVDRDVVRDSPQSGQSHITVTTRWKNKGQWHSYQLQSVRSEP